MNNKGADQSAQAGLCPCFHMQQDQGFSHRDPYNSCTWDVFYVRREVDLMKTAKVNVYIMHMFGMIELNLKLFQNALH